MKATEKNKQKKLEIGNNPMRALYRKIHVFFGNALPKFNARAHLKLKQGKDIVPVDLYHVYRPPPSGL